MDLGKKTTAWRWYIAIKTVLGSLVTNAVDGFGLDWIGMDRN